jgi:hypothetical protein
MHAGPHDVEPPPLRFPVPAIVNIKAEFRMSVRTRESPILEAIVAAVSSLSDAAALFS